MSEIEHKFNEFEDLPDDPEVAFAILQERMYADLVRKWEEGQHRGVYEETRFINTLTAYDKVYGLGILTDYKNPPYEQEAFDNFFEEFRRHVDFASQQFKIEAARRTKTGGETIILLDPETRKEINALINEIKEKLNEITLPENKREALFKKLNAFAAEVDQNRTRTEAFYAFAFDTSRAIKKVGGELKPFQRVIDRVGDIIDKANKLFDALPPMDEQKRIEGPVKRLSPPEQDVDVDAPL